MARRKQKRTRRKTHRKRAGHRRNVGRMRKPAKNPFRSPYNMNLQSLEIIRENNRRTQEEFAKAWDSKNMSQSQAWENKAVEAMADLRRARAEAKLLAAHSVTPTHTPSQNLPPAATPHTDLISELTTSRIPVPRARLRRLSVSPVGGDITPRSSTRQASPSSSVKERAVAMARRRTLRSVALHGPSQE